MITSNHLRSAAFCETYFVDDVNDTGTNAINGTGNTVADILTGKGADNTLNGGSGADTSIGDHCNGRHGEQRSVHRRYGKRCNHLGFRRRHHRVLTERQSGHSGGEHDAEKYALDLVAMLPMRIYCSQCMKCWTSPRILALLRRSSGAHHVRGTQFQECGMLEGIVKNARTDRE